MADTYWIKSLANELYTTEPTVKIPSLIVTGNTKLGGTLLFNKTGSDEVEIKSASLLGYDYVIWNKTKNIYRLFIDNLGKVSIGTNAGTAKFTVLETTEGNAWPAASFINTSNVGFGIEVIGGNAGNNTATFKNYSNALVSYITGYGELWASKDVSSNAGTNTSDVKHYRLKNGSDRFSLGLISTEEGNNSGSNFTIYRYDDSGSALGRVLLVYRDTGDIDFENSITVRGNLDVLGEITGSYIHNHTLASLEDVDALASPILGENGKVLVTQDGKWIKGDLMDYVEPPDLSDYYTKSQSDARFAAKSHQTNYSNPHNTTFQQILTVDNTTSLPIVVNNSITANSLTVGSSTMAYTDKLNISSGLYIDGTLSFNAIEMYLSNLIDVDDSLDSSEDGSILKKEGGIWKAVVVQDIDLSNYLTVVSADAKFVFKEGDTMTGELAVPSLVTNSPDAGVVNTIKLNGTIISSTDITSGVHILNLYGSTYRIKRDDKVLYEINSEGTIIQGVGEEDSSAGNLLIQNNLPTITLNNSNSSAYGKGFRIINSGNITSFQVSGNNFGGTSTLVELVGNSSSTSEVRLKYGGNTKLVTTSAGVTVSNQLSAQSILLNGINITKNSGDLVVDSNMYISGEYYYGPNRTPVRLQYLDQLEDVDLGVDTAYDINYPFLLGSVTGNTAVSPLSIQDIISLSSIVTATDLSAHVTNNIVHITGNERTNWNLAFNNISKVKDWNLLYNSSVGTEIGLSHISSSGAELSTIDTKYLFYWDGGTKRAIKTKVSDNALALGGKPLDEFRYSRAMGFSGADPDNTLTRSLYDLGVVSANSMGVPEDGPWQIETIDAAFTYNQGKSLGEQYLHQFATKWYDTETDFSMWARTRDGFSQSWMPWVEFMHSGNTPYSIELYIDVTPAQLQELQKESNWSYSITPGTEVYIGSLDASINVGQKIVDDFYIYEVTPTGVRRMGTNIKYLRHLYDINIPVNYEDIEIDEVLSYKGNGYWEPRKIDSNYTVEEFTLSSGDHVIATNIDRSEVLIPTGTTGTLSLTIDKDRFEPVVIVLTNEDPLIEVDVYYATTGSPVKLLTMKPNTNIEVIPGSWELN